jgi:hypothetical protein
VGKVGFRFVSQVNEESLRKGNDGRVEHCFRDELRRASDQWSQEVGSKLRPRQKHDYLALDAHIRVQKRLLCRVCVLAIPIFKILQLCLSANQPGQHEQRNSNISTEYHQKTNSWAISGDFRAGTKNLQTLSIKYGTTDDSSVAKVDYCVILMRLG